jgi:hypothetical protein
MGAAKSLPRLAQCPVCGETIQRPTSPRWNVVAFCPRKGGRWGVGARGPYFNLQDGHRLAYSARNMEALTAKPPGFLRRLWIVLVIGVRGLWRALCYLGGKS